MTSRPYGEEVVTIPGRVGKEQVRNPLKAFFILRRLYKDLRKMSKDFDALYTDGANWLKGGAL